jgi:hypothetical protein
VFGEFRLLELSRLTLFKFRIKVLKIKRKPNSLPPLGSSILTPAQPRAGFFLGALAWAWATAQPTGAAGGGEDNR